MTLRDVLELDEAFNDKTEIYITDLSTAWTTKGHWNEDHMLDLLDSNLEVKGYSLRKDRLYIEVDRYKDPEVEEKNNNKDVYLILQAPALREGQGKPEIVVAPIDDKEYYAAFMRMRYKFIGKIEMPITEKELLNGMKEYDNRVRNTSEDREVFHKESERKRTL